MGREDGKVDVYTIEHDRATPSMLYPLHLQLSSSCSAFHYNGVLKIMSSSVTRAEPSEVHALL